MTFGLRFLIAIVFLPIFGRISAQDEADFPILADGETVTITLEGNIAPNLLTYDGQAGEVITLTAQDVSDGDAVDLVMEILRPDGRRLAFNDDHLTEIESIALAQTDPAFVNLILPMSGLYIIRVNSYGGIFAGEAQVKLDVVDGFAVEIISDDETSRIIEATLPRYQTFTTSLETIAGSTYVLTIRDLNGTLDPLLRLRSESGDVIAENDDHAGYHLNLNANDSRLVYEAAENAVLTIEVIDFLGRAGTFELAIIEQTEDN
ncbi:MAG: hypothetical protein RLP44_06300 [Aggregatilineales bacterium]